MTFFDHLLIAASGFAFAVVVLAIVNRNNRILENQIAELRKRIYEEERKTFNMRQSLSALHTFIKSYSDDIAKGVGS